MDYNPKVSIIIVTYNNAKEIQKCINSVLEQAFEPFEIIIVDNASVDNTVNLIQESFPEICVIRNQDNLGFGGGNNTGVKHASATLLFS